MKRCPRPSPWTPHHGSLAAGVEGHPPGVQASIRALAAVARGRAGPVLAIAQLDSRAVGLAVAPGGFERGHGLPDMIKDFDTLMITSSPCPRPYLLSRVATGQR
jgi:hypothetical protein